MDGRRRSVIGVAVVLVILVAAGTLIAALGPSRHRGHRVADRPFPVPVSQPSPSLLSGSERFTPVPPVTVVPEQNPVQQQYDQALAQGLGSSATVHAAEASQVPGPAFADGWGPLPVTYDPAAWTEQFVQGLLGINFARQSRTGLGSWLSAEEAAELLPGVPAPIQNKVLYLSLFDTTAVGGGASPIPTTGTWQADALAGTVWSVSDLVVTPDPQWSQITADGWQPIDERFGVEDVTGLLTVEEAGKGIAHRFSLTLYTGSAHWHEGYGTVLVTAWKET